MRLVDRIERLERIEAHKRSGATTIELVNPLTGEVMGIIPPRCAAPTVVYEILDASD